MRDWFKANGGFLAIAVLGLFILGWTNKWLGLALVIVGVVGYVLRSLLLPVVPWRIALVRKDSQPAVTSTQAPKLPLFLPLWLNPLTSRKQAANILLEEGYNLLKTIPNEPGSPLAAALVGVEAGRHAKLLAQWEGRVTTFLHARATEHTALFHPSAGLPPSGPAMRTYLTQRLDELKAIHAQL